jgi:hypothetical protein
MTNGSNREPFMVCAMILHYKTEVSVGTEAVNWITSRTTLSSRESAVKFGQQLLDENIFQLTTAADKREFVDSTAFIYQLRVPVLYHD